MGWKTLEPGLSPTAGCGVDPPPSAVTCVDDSDTDAGYTYDEFASSHIMADADKLASSGEGCSGVMPRYLSVSGAESVEVNGIYAFSGELNCRPYYKLVMDGHRHSKKEEQTLDIPSIWYFSSCPLAGSTRGAVSYNGWYLSRRLQTSSYSAGDDMYCAYSSASAVPLERALWVTRKPGVGPLSGCGRGLPPSIQFLAAPMAAHGTVKPIASTSEVMLLRLALPTGRIVSMEISEHTTVYDVKVWIDITHKSIRAYGIQLKLKSRIMKDSTALVMHGTGINTGDLLIVEETLAPQVMPIPQYAKHVLIVGAGPVGNLFSFKYFPVFSAEMFPDY